MHVPTVGGGGEKRGRGRGGGERGAALTRLGPSPRSKQVRNCPAAPRTHAQRHRELCCRESGPRKRNAFPSELPCWSRQKGSKEKSFDGENTWIQRTCRRSLLLRTAGTSPGKSGKKPELKRRARHHNLGEETDNSSNAGECNDSPASAKMDPVG